MMVANLARFLRQSPGPDEFSLVYRGDGWNVQYAVAKGARLAAGKEGYLWYTSDDLGTLEYLRDVPERSKPGCYGLNEYAAAVGVTGARPNSRRRNLRASFIVRPLTSPLC